MSTLLSPTLGKIAVCDHDKQKDRKVELNFSGRYDNKDTHIEVLAIVFLIYSQKYYGVFIDNAAMLCYNSYEYKP